ncbi:MAG: cysteine hydrolase [Proteobacteria bacterium]|nr:cysteine hydrolase [Pseudomonadota bacterium]MDA0993788.1 cysteine hydrolase [Pseudomonadota bacterium]
MSESVRKWDPFVLLLIDVQRDFWSADMSQAFPDYQNNVRALLANCRQAQIDIVHLRARFRADESDWMVKYKLLGHVPCVEGTQGSEVFPFANELPGEKVITKQTFDGFQNPELQLYLRENKKRFILVAGLVTSVCVLLTAAHAAQRGYLVGIVEDCCGDEPDAHRQTLERYPFIFCRTKVDQISSDLEGWLSDLSKLEVE